MAPFSECNVYVNYASTIIIIVLCVLYVVDEADVHVSLSGQERNTDTISHRTHFRSDGCIRQYRDNETTRGRREGGLIRTKHVGSMDVFN